MRDFQPSCKKSNRGFTVIDFKDRYGTDCHVQESSMASEDCLWLGVNVVKPIIMARAAQKLGLPTHGETVGWVPFAVPKEVQLNGVMHLNRKQVQGLVTVLQRWLASGNLPENPEPIIARATEE